MKIGVLAIQGDVSENIAASQEALGTSGSAVEVWDDADIDSIDALVIPGGESTTIGSMSEISGAMRAIKRRVESDSLPVLAICAGLVIASRAARDRVCGARGEPLGLLDVDVERNSFGHQSQSFEAAVSMPGLGIDTLNGVFIRAPTILRAGDGVETLARIDERIIAVRQGSVIGIAFHPELDGAVLHRSFAQAAAKSS